VHPSPVAVTTPERTTLVNFEGEAMTGVPPQVADFVTRFFESMKEDWRRGIQFMNRENYQEMRASDPKLDPVRGDALVLVLSISLHRFYGSDDPPDTDSEVERLKAISKVRILKFEQNEQVLRFGGKTELEDGRVYGLQLVIARDELGVLGPL
jgi:hypothetical protein